MADKAVPEEKVQLYLKRNDFCPFVLLQINGLTTEFLVDTGSRNTVITWKQIRKWGAEDQVEFDEESEAYHINVQFSLFGGFSTYVCVKDYPKNLLGLVFFQDYQCDIDLQQGQLTVRRIINEELGNIDFITDTVHVNGHEAEVMLDTGAESFLELNEEQAEELQLQLTDVSAEGMTVTTLYGEESILYTAEEVCVRAYGKEVKDEVIVSQLDGCPILGMTFLIGSLIRFHGDNKFDITFQENPTGIKMKTRVLKKRRLPSTIASP